MKLFLKKFIHCILVVDNGNFKKSLQVIFGHVAEWLGEGLQNPLQRFESARDLKKSAACEESESEFTRS
jgi:hypothetical protein